jgi:hypothetical protein
VHPDILTWADARHMLDGALTIDPDNAQVRPLVERVLASIRSATPPVADNPKYTGFFANAADASGALLGWWAPVEWEPQVRDVSFLRDERAGDARRVSTVADAWREVDAYIARGAPTVWPNVDAALAAFDIRRRCSDHRLFRQGSLNLCGPAAFLHIWAGRDPLGYARYALGLLERGEGAIGTTTVRSTAAFEALRAPAIGALNVPIADFICLASLRNHANLILPYHPEWFSEPLEAITGPGVLADWLRATDRFFTVSDEANLVLTRGIDHALALVPGAGADIVLLINANVLLRATQVEFVTGGPASNPVDPNQGLFGFIRARFPNHFVTLLDRIARDPRDDTLTMSVWTWGTSYVFSGIPVSVFSTNYYGAVVTSLSP